MKYKRINDRDIEIISEDAPIQNVLEVMARVSYELAKPVGMGF